MLLLAYRHFYDWDKILQMVGLCHYDCVRINVKKILRPVLFVVQVMSDTTEQDCIHNKRIPQCTKMRTYVHHK